MTKRKQRLQLKIVLDTNAIWTGGESFLLRREMSDLVDTNRGDAHLEIEWILPDVVLRERVYQMQREAAALLPSLSRLERVIGHPLNITEDIVKSRISETVKRQVEEHQIVVRQALYNNIDWPRLVENAVNRRPPFENKTEKGFRDAIIAETFMQLVAEAPEQAQRCRIVLLTNDALLAESVKLRLSSRGNVQILSSIDELKGLINTLISTVPEDYVVRMQVKAKEYFFENGDDEQGLVYDLNIQSAVRAQFNEQLEAKPEGTYRRSNGNWKILPPRFVKKDGQRIFWTSRFLIDAKAYKTIPQQLPTYESIPGTSLIGAEKSFFSGNSPWQEVSTGLNFIAKPSTPIGGIPSVSISQAYPGVVSFQPNINLASLAATGSEILAATGKTVIDVNWSVSVNIKGVFSKPKLESIEFIETSWERVP